MAVLLRVPGADGRFVLFDNGSRFGPPGGALAYRPGARAALTELGWRPERRAGADGLVDLRGFVPIERLADFREWFDSGADREDAADGLRRELIEELAEVGVGELVARVGGVVFGGAGTVVEGPAIVADRSFRQLRSLTLFDIAADPDGLRDGLVAAADDPGVPGVLAVTPADIARGELDGRVIGDHAAYLG